MRDLLRSLARDRRGNVAMMFGLTLPVILLGAGSAIDYSLAMRQQARLDAIADAAALSAVSANAMQSTDSTAAQAAENLFTAEATSLPNTKVIATPSCSQTYKQPCITVTHPGGAATRTVVVNYSATYSTIFSGVLGAASLNLSGSATAVSAASPNTDFYVLLDNSSSMTIPANQTGINLLQSKTINMNSPVGCAFACHMVNTQWSEGGSTSAAYFGMPCQTGYSGNNCPRMDPYAYAHSLGITLRFDEVVTAVNGVVADAQSQQAALPSPPVYRFEVDSLDSPTAESSANPGYYSVMSLTQNYVTQWSSSKSGLQVNEQYDWNGDQACNTSGGPTTCTGGNSMVSNGRYVDNGYLSSKLTQSLVALANKIPAAGSGTSGNANAEVVFLVTDGLEDYVVNGAFNITPLSAAGQAACTKLKNNGVRVAVLYTTYYPIPGFWMYDQYVASIQNQLPTALQSCASDGLFMTANVGDDIAGELKTLFEIASGSSKLTQ